jgi:hypothetical protein
LFFGSSLDAANGCTQNIALAHSSSSSKAAVQEEGPRGCSEVPTEASDYFSTIFLVMQSHKAAAAIVGKTGTPHHGFLNSTDWLQRNVYMCM